MRLDTALVAAPLIGVSTVHAALTLLSSEP